MTENLIFVAHIDTVFPNQALIRVGDRISGTLDNFLGSAILLAMADELDCAIYWTQYEEDHKWDGQTWIQVLTPAQYEELNEARKLAQVLKSKNANPVIVVLDVYNSTWTDARLAIGLYNLDASENGQIYRALNTTSVDFNLANFVESNMIDLEYGDGSILGLECGFRVIDVGINIGKWDASNFNEESDAEPWHHHSAISTEHVRDAKRAVLALYNLFK